MAKLKIFGKANPVVGTKEFYSIKDLFGNSASAQFNEPNFESISDDQVKWSVWVLNGKTWKKTTENNETGITVCYMFSQKSLKRKSIRMLVEVNGEKAVLDIVTQKASQGKILHVDLLDNNYNKPARPFAYGDWIIARVHCVDMEMMPVKVTLWEDDGDKAKQNSTNVKIEIKKGDVLNGKADVAFYLDPSHKWLANAKLAPGDENEGEFHEYYVTAEIFEKVSKRIASKNTNVPNPDYKKEPEAKKQTPAEQKGPSKKETKKIALSDKKVQDYHEQKIVVKNEISKNPVWEKINSLMMVDVGDSIWNKNQAKPKLVIFPLLVKPENDKENKWGKTRNWTAKQGANMTTYNSNRNSGARKHAARDLYTKPLTEVVAIADGTVLEIADFYCLTHQITIRHTLKDGRDFIIRYGELDPQSITVKAGDKIKQKHVLGKTGKLLDFIKKTGKYVPLMKIKDEIVYMLHFEYYNGNLGFDLNKNPLTNWSKPFLRRNDLLDPLSILKEGYKNSFEIDIDSKEEIKELFDEEDARMALLKVYKEYGEKTAIIVEKMYRLETDHFKSEQYQYCGTGGMEVFGKAPYYGWDSSTFKQHPEYTPVGTWSAMENEGLDSKGGNAQQKDKPKNFVKLPSVLAGMIYKADYINRYDGNYASWYNKSNSEAQEKYRESLKGIIPRIVNTF
ncbi:M23 family metallopeptidase [Flavobacterium johnsoniae]|uniref:M23 family metallopeptidase n=1 Tax=Flavobacterium johnsoniae TaxID=986 RepID=UPI003D953A78